MGHLGLIGALRRITGRHLYGVRNYETVKEETVEHITLTGDRSGEYVLVEERTDGSLVVAPDTSIGAIRKRAGTRAMTPEEFEEHFGDLPSDGEG